MQQRTCKELSPTKQDGQELLHRSKCIAQDIGEDICTEDHAEDDRTCRRGQEEDSSCMSSPAYLLLRILSCISPLARSLLLSNMFLSFWRRGYFAEVRLSAGISVVEVQKLVFSFAISAVRARPLRGSAWSRCKN